MSERSWKYAMSGGARSSRQWLTGRSGIDGLRDEGEVALGHDVGEVVVVDVRVDRLERDLRAQAGFERLQERAVGLRVPQVAALGVGEREPARGGDDVDRPDRLVQTLGHEGAQLSLL